MNIPARILVIAASIWLQRALAQMPSLLNYQGRLTANGTNVFTGPGWFKFALVNGGTNLSRQATAVATVSGGYLTVITVTDGGTGYVETPSVSITDVSGSNAVARATIAGGVVTGVTMLNPGRHYSPTPTVTIAPPPPNFAFVSHWSHDGTSSGGGEPVSAVPLTVDAGVFSVNLGDSSLSNMTAAVAPTIFTNEDVRLRVWFSDGTNIFELFYPDQRLASAGYASYSAIAGTVTAGGVGSAGLVADPGSLAKVSGGTMTSVAGWIGIGTNSPRSALDVVGKITATAIQGNGAVPWEVVSGTEQQAAPNTGYLANNSNRVTITLPAAPAVGDVVRVAGMGAGGWRILSGSGQSVLRATIEQAGTTWAAQGPGAAWCAVASSGDGWRVVAATESTNNWEVSQGRIYTSRDGGTNWTECASIHTNWSAVASSADGLRLVAVAYGGPIVTSSDGGTNWVVRAMRTNWACVASSADGKNLIAGVRAYVANKPGYLYTSTDYGATWTARGNLGNWIDVASSADGRRLYGVSGGLSGIPGPSILGQTIASSDGGETWLDVSPLNPTSGGMIACSADGMRLFLSVACSADGNVLIRGGPQVSRDWGITWSAVPNPPIYTGAATSSADGARLIAVRNQGRIHVSVSTPPPGSTTETLTGAQDAAAEFQYVGNGRFRVLSREGDVSWY